MRGEIACAGENMNVIPAFVVVMARLVRAIHVFSCPEDVDAPPEAGHDGEVPGSV
jgi:hypothetical protein